MATSTQDWIEELKGISVLELAERNQGARGRSSAVSAAAVAAPGWLQATGGAGAQTARLPRKGKESGTVDVIPRRRRRQEDPGDQGSCARRPALGLKEAKALVDEAPKAGQGGHRKKTRPTSSSRNSRRPAGRSKSSSGVESPDPEQGPSLRRGPLLRLGLRKPLRERRLRPGRAGTARSDCLTGPRAGFFLPPKPVTDPSLRKAHAGPCAEQRTRPPPGSPTSNHQPVPASRLGHRPVGHRLPTTACAARRAQPRAGAHRARRASRNVGGAVACPRGKAEGAHCRKRSPHRARLWLEAECLVEAHGPRQGPPTKWIGRTFIADALPRAPLGAPSAAELDEPRGATSPDRRPRAWSGGSAPAAGTRVKLLLCPFAWSCVATPIC